MEFYTEQKTDKKMTKIAKKFSGMIQIKHSAAPNNESLEFISEVIESQDSLDYAKNLGKLSLVGLEKKVRKDRKEAADLFLKKNVKIIISQHTAKRTKRHST
jgi:hypothetical protein